MMLSSSVGQIQWLPCLGLRVSLLIGKLSFPIASVKSKRWLRRKDGLIVQRWTTQQIWWPGIFGWRTGEFGHMVARSWIPGRRPLGDGGPGGVTWWSFFSVRWSRWCCVSIVWASSSCVSAGTMEDFHKSHLCGCLGATFHPEFEVLTHRQTEGCLFIWWTPGCQAVFDPCWVVVGVVGWWGGGGGGGGVVVVVGVVVGKIDPFNQVFIEEDLWKTFPHSHRVGDHTAWGRILCQLETIDLRFRWSQCWESSHTNPFSPGPYWWVLWEVNPYPSGIWQWPSSSLCNESLSWTNYGKFGPVIISGTCLHGVVLRGSVTFRRVRLSLCRTTSNLG